MKTKPTTVRDQTESKRVPQFVVGLFLLLLVPFIYRKNESSKSAVIAERMARYDLEDCRCTFDVQRKVLVQTCASGTFNYEYTDHPKLGEYLLDGTLEEWCVVDDCHRLVNGPSVDHPLFREIVRPKTAHQWFREHTIYGPESTSLILLMALVMLYGIYLCVCAWYS